ncbi:ABC transporter transmembrane domain-containing protein [Hirsutella rhossiliensis]|uniref:ABC transporter transmembrane domain-containing protein n=1 Tax=Hirsutella rhossiliensis TaxID=111463 RepID=A0A9P8SJ09_9HYPO|nr:ABC transporter transmembrane domain-containing protein [Hirsutella rhossiliensis]KAH0964788.1 ABC transporter transmembrane domain-containing protein [Hirsutella rhossiliensis]
MATEIHRSTVKTCCGPASYPSKLVPTRSQHVLGARVLKRLKKLLGYFAIYVREKPTRLDIAPLVIGIITAIASGVPFLLLGILFGQLIDDSNDRTCEAVASSRGLNPVIQDSYQATVNGKILYIVYLAIVQFVLIYVDLVCWSLGGARLAQRLREQYLRSLLQQEPSFFDHLPAGEVASRPSGDIQTIRAGTSDKVGICLSSLAFFLTSYTVAFVKNSKLAGILILLVPAYFFMSPVGGWFIETYSSRASDRFAASSSIAPESLSNVPVVHSFGANKGLKPASQHICAGLMYFIAYGANALAFWQGSRMIADAVERNGQGATVGSIFTVICILVDATLILN